MVLIEREAQRESLLCSCVCLCAVCVGVCVCVCVVATLTTSMLTSLVVIGAGKSWKKSNPHKVPAGYELVETGIAVRCIVANVL